LNWFERALLVERMREMGMEKDGKLLAQAMELEVRGRKQTGEEFKRFFETILNAKKESAPPPPPPSAPGLFGAPPPPPGASFFGGYASPPPMACFSAQPQMEQCNLMSYSEDLC
jgi:hypothetical protein